MSRIFGFDIDGVLTNDDDGQQNLWIIEAVKFFNKPILQTSFHIEDALGVDRRQVSAFFAAKGEEIIANVPIREGVLSAIRSLKRQGITVYLITARNEGFRKVTEEWLRTHEVPYDQLFMHPSKPEYFSKGKKCRELGVEFFVDDNFDNVLDVHKAGVYTLMFHATHNHGKVAPVPTVYNWSEITEHIDHYLGTTETRKQA